MYVSETRITSLRNFDVTIDNELNHGLSDAYHDAKPDIYDNLMKDPHLNAYQKTDEKTPGGVTPIRFFVPNRGYPVLGLIDQEGLDADEGSTSGILNMGGQKEPSLKITREQHVLVADEAGRIQKIAMRFIKVSKIEDISDGSKTT